MRDYFPTKHAVTSMAARDIPWAEVLWVLEQPEVTYSNTSKGPHAGKHTQIHQRGRLYVVVSLIPEYSRHDAAKEHPLYTVVTTGLRTQRQWTNEDARARRT